MNRLAFIIGGVALTTWGMSGALTACGGDDGAAPTDSDGGNTSSSGGSSSGAASSSGGSSSGSTNDAGPGDAGGDAGGDGGGDGGPSNPGKITCAATECTAGTQICCRSFNGDAGCVAANTCQGPGTSELACDEKADCQGGDVCCRGFQGDTECKNQCGNLEIAVCKSNAECADGGTCKEWSCPGNLTVRSCSMPFQGCQ